MENKKWLSLVGDFCLVLAVILLSIISIIRCFEKDMLSKKIEEQQNQIIELRKEITELKQYTEPAIDTLRID